MYLVKGHCRSEEGRVWVRLRLPKVLGKSAGNDNKEIIDVKIEEIDRNPYQPRKEFNEFELRDLAASIQEYGVIQPIIVRRCQSRFQLVAGERRLRACKMAGWTEIPAIVYEIDEDRAAAMALVENLQRKELNYFEEAQAYAVLIGEFGFTQEEVARKLGKSQSAIANKLRLLRLPQEIRDRIMVDVITERHARALLKLDDAGKQAEVIQAIYEQGLTVKQTEELVEKIGQNISREIKKREQGRNIAIAVKDVRIFVNTIKETVFRARETGVNMVLLENEREDEYELVIKIPKNGVQGLTRYSAGAKDRGKTLFNFSAGKSPSVRKGMKGG